MAITQKKRRRIEGEDVEKPPWVTLRYIYLCVVSIVFLKSVRCPTPEIIDHGDEADG